MKEDKTYTKIITAIPEGYRVSRIDLSKVYVALILEKSVSNEAIITSIEK